jgi:hypothetical protein
MTALATHTIAEFKGLSLLLRGHIERVTDQALRSFRWRTEVEDSADTFGNIVL